MVVTACFRASRLGTTNRWNRAAGYRTARILKIINPTGALGQGSRQLAMVRGPSRCIRIKHAKVACTVVTYFCRKLTRTQTTALWRSGYCFMPTLYFCTGLVTPLLWPTLRYLEQNCQPYSAPWRIYSLIIEIFPGYTMCYDGGGCSIDRVMCFLIKNYLAYRPHQHVGDFTLSDLHSGVLIALSLIHI